MKAKPFGDPYYLDVSGFRDILKYDQGAIDENPRDLYFYGTNGLFLDNQPSMLGSMGEVEASAEYRPGIRCKSISDALNLQAKISSINIGDICFDTRQGSGTGISGERLFTYDPVNQVCKRRRYGNLGLGDVKQWPYDFAGEFEETPPEINGQKLRQYQKAYPLAEVSAFFARNNDAPEQLQTLPWFRIGTAMYWETDQKIRTGAVYIDAWLGAWEQLRQPAEGYSDYRGLYKTPLSFGYEIYTPYEPPFVAMKSIYLFVGMQPADYRRMLGGNDAGNYSLDVRTKSYTLDAIEFDIIFYRYMVGDATWDNPNLIYDYLVEVK